MKLKVVPQVIDKLPLNDKIFRFISQLPNLSQIANIRQSGVEFLYNRDPSYDIDRVSLKIPSRDLKIPAKV